MGHTSLLPQLIHFNTNALCVLVERAACA